MTTYTIAIHEESGMLLACEPDGTDMDAALAAEADRATIEIDPADVRIESGLMLTDDPVDGDDVIYSGTSMGHLTDERGVSYMAAVRR